MTKRDKYLRSEWGITDKKYRALLSGQNGVCPICLKPPKEGKNLHVEHDHTSGEIRGLCCFYCNKRVIGRYTHESIPMLYRLIAYLDGYWPADIELKFRYTGLFVPKKKKKRKRKKKQVKKSKEILNRLSKKYSRSLERLAKK